MATFITLYLTVFFSFSVTKVRIILKMHMKGDPKYTNKNERRVQLWV